MNKEDEDMSEAEALVEGESVGDLVEVESSLPIQAPAQLPTNPAQMLGLAVVQGNLDVGTMKELMALEKEYRAEQARIEFDVAAAKFAGLREVIPTNKVGTGPGGSTFPYADYPATVKAITPWLKKAGLSFSHTQDDPVVVDGNVVLINVRCILKAKSGHTESAPFPAVPDERIRSKLSPSQLIQNAITYAKRQTLCMVLGLATGEDGAFDDDGVPANLPSQTAKPVGKGNNATPASVNLMKAQCKAKGLNEATVCYTACEVRRFEDVPASRVNEVFELIKAQG